MTPMAPANEPVMQLRAAIMGGWRSELLLSVMVISARARILGWMLVLVALAVGASIVVARSILIARLDERLDRELAQEVYKFRSFAGQYSGPRDIDVLLSRYLEQKVPDHNETFFSIVDGRAARRVAADSPARVDSDRALARRLAAATTPAYGWAETTAGRARYAVVPVSIRGDPRAGQLVAIEFRDLERAEVDESILVLVLVGLGALIVAGAVGYLIAGRVLAPVRLVRSTAEQIGESDLTRRIEVRGNDDVALLARTFNHMLDRLQDAFTTQRRFLDDAGHELRTPITVIRGHLEVMSEDPADRASTMALVMRQLDRMKRIVDDLLLLAKAQQPDFLHPGPVELADLTVELLATARVLGDRRWRLDALAEETVEGDGERLTQALMQLAHNAVAHTHPGDVIEIGSAIRGRRVELWVRDTGPGVNAEVRERIFDRFSRGDGATREGAGLGLAIVASIADAHGGHVRLDSTPGHGATFTLDLPLRRPRAAHGSSA
jgi:two-component system OmpR family sensor kinase